MAHFLIENYFSFGICASLGAAVYWWEALRGVVIEQAFYPVLVGSVLSVAVLALAS